MVAFHGRHRPAEQNEGHRNRWNRRSCSRAPFASCHPVDRKGCPIDQGRFLQVGSRHLPRTPTFAMAGKIWVVQRERVAIGHAHSLHQQAGAASLQYNVPGGIPGVAEEAPDRIRRGVSVGLSSAVPSGLASFPRVPGSELPGYYRQSLRDYSPVSAPKMSKLQSRVQLCATIGRQTHTRKGEGNIRWHGVRVTELRSTTSKFHLSSPRSERGKDLGKAPFGMHTCSLTAISRFTFDRGSRIVYSPASWNHLLLCRAVKCAAKRHR